MYYILLIISLLAPTSWVSLLLSVDSPAFHRAAVQGGRQRPAVFCRHISQILLRGDIVGGARMRP